MLMNSAPFSDLKPYRSILWKSLKPPTNCALKHGCLCCSFRYGLHSQPKVRCDVPQRGCQRSGQHRQRHPLLKHEELPSCRAWRHSHRRRGYAGRCHTESKDCRGFFSHIQTCTGDQPFRACLSYGCHPQQRLEPWWRHFEGCHGFSRDGTRIDPLSQVPVSKISNAIPKFVKFHPKQNCIGSNLPIMCFSSGVRGFPGKGNPQLPGLRRAHNLRGWHAPGPDSTFHLERSSTAIRYLIALVDEICDEW